MKSCTLCKKLFTPTGQGNFRYCPICREKIANRQVEKSNAYWLTEPDRTKQRATYHRRMNARKARYARVQNGFCHWCERPIDRAKMSNHPHQKFCDTYCSRADRKERDNLTGFYHFLSKKGNEKQKHVEMIEGVRPGTEKRRAHTKALNEARRNGKSWGKTGPKKKLR
jgi:RNA polymerase-binding transcription factor DksA